MTNKSKSYLILTVMLLAGVAIGVAATATYIRHNIDFVLSQGPQHARDDFIDSLSQRLELNATQRELAEELVFDLHAKAQDLNEQTHRRLKELFDLFIERLGSDLSEHQRKELNAIAEELRTSPPPAPPPFFR